MSTAITYKDNRSQRSSRAALPQPADPMVATTNLVFRPTSGVNSTDTRAGS